MKTQPGESDSEPHITSVPQRKVVAAFAAIYILWGSTYLGIRYAIASLPPFLMAGSRFFTAGMILFLIECFRNESKPTLRQWWNAAIAGGLMLLVGNGGVTWAEQVIPSGVASLLVALVPLWMVLIDWARPTGVRPRPLVIVGLIVGFVGVAFLARGKADNGNSTYTWAVVGLLLSSMGWALGAIFSRHADKPKSSLLAVGIQMIGGGVLLMLVATLKGELTTFSPAKVTATSLAAWFYLMIFGSLIGFSAYGWLLQVSTPAKVSTSAYVNPLIAVILGCTIGREPLSHELFVAGGLIILAVAMIVRSNSRKKAKLVPTPVVSAVSKPV